MTKPLASTMVYVVIMTGPDDSCIAGVYEYEAHAAQCRDDLNRTNGPKYWATVEKHLVQR